MCNAGRDAIDLAMAGHAGQLRAAIDKIRSLDNIKIPKHYTTAEWEALLPSWKGKDHPRGLKSWGSKTKRGSWSVQGICARVIQKALYSYMFIFAVPPVQEGHVNNDGELTRKEGGIDLFKTFAMTLHRAYCKYLDPEVPLDSMAAEVLLKYMLHKPVKMKLLRAVSYTAVCHCVVSWSMRHGGVSLCGVMEHASWGCVLE